MDENPYESPRTSVLAKPTTRWQERFPASRFELAIACGLFVFLVAAVCHRLQLPIVADDATETNIRVYTGSPLIALEVIGVLSTFATIPVLIVRSIYLFWQKRVFAAVVALVLCPASFGALLLAMWIDAPTLIYAT